MDKPTVEAMTAQFLAHADSLTAAHWEQGADWYPAARREARRLARQYNHGLVPVVGAIAALSPRKRWTANITAAESVLRGQRPLATFYRSYDKARRIVDWGEHPETVLRGPKESSFYRNILGDTDTVTIDSWMLRSAGWPRDTVSPKQYRDIAEALTAAAGTLDVQPRTLQAALWLQAKNGPQLRLF